MILPAKKYRFLLSLTFIVLIISGIWYLFQNKSSSSVRLQEISSEMHLRDGETLAKIYCSGCHRFPEPGLLDRRTWSRQTLPAMGPHLGINKFAGKKYPRDVTPGLPDGFYPEKAMIDSLTWQKIIDYYITKAPERFEFPDTGSGIVEEDLFFQVRRPSYRTNSNPMVSAIRFDAANQLIYIADAATERLLVFDRTLEVVASFDVPSPVSDIQFTGNTEKRGIRHFLITQIGNLAPSDAREGAVLKGWYNPDTGEGDFSSVIIDELTRPVETIETDLDEDGHNDLLISEFGHRNGSIFWLKNAGDQYDLEKRVLIETPGCMQSHVTDFTQNGHPDILVLCTQTDQAIYLFENNGEGEFNRSILLQFPITAGSSSFELVDFNQDELPDILYTSGDNADYSLTYKPYHGVYIYLNEGNNTFSKKWFYQMNGAYSAKAADFDDDGLPDIAAISFFADYAKKPQEGFIFFKNHGDFTFTPYHPPATSYGRWIAMDVADWTGNSSADIVLANFSLGPTKVLPQIESILTQSPHLLILEN